MIPADQATQDTPEPSRKPGLGLNGNPAGGDRGSPRPGGLGDAVTVGRDVHGEKVKFVPLDQEQVDASKNGLRRNYANEFQRAQRIMPGATMAPILMDPNQASTWGNFIGRRSNRLRQAKTGSERRLRPAGGVPFPAVPPIPGSLRRTALPARRQQSDCPPRCSPRSRKYRDRHGSRWIVIARPWCSLARFVALRWLRPRSWPKCLPPRQATGPIRRAGSHRLQQDRHAVSGAEGPRNHILADAYSPDLTCSSMNFSMSPESFSVISSPVWILQRARNKTMTATKMNETGSRNTESLEQRISRMTSLPVIFRQSDRVRSETRPLSSPASIFR